MQAKVLLVVTCLICFLHCNSQNDVRAWYADGQVFVVWQFAVDSVETYGIYASPTPFSNTEDAILIGRPFYHEYIGYALKDNLQNFTATYKIPNKDEGFYQLEEHEGLFVYTPHQSDSLYFGVTVFGNTEVLEGQNITETAIEFNYDPVNDPVECHLQSTFPSPFSTDFTCYAFCMWVDGRQNHWEGRPDFPIMANKAKNGMPGLFMISVPNDIDTTVSYPLSVWLHGAGGRARQSLAGSRSAINIDPSLGILLAHHDRLQGYRGTAPPLPDQSTWHFGWSKNYNPFHSTALSMDTVINYTQKRYLWIEEWLLGKFNIDPNRIHLHGHSMGGTGGTALAKCYPEHYASATLFNTSCTGPQSDAASSYLGSVEDNFPTNLRNRKNESVHLYDLWDMYTNCSPQRDLPIIKYWHGKQDNNGTNHWGSVGIDSYVHGDSLGTGLIGFWGERGHGLNQAAEMGDHWIMGNGISQQTILDNVNFQEHLYRSDESYPAFFNHRLDQKNNDPGMGIIGIDNGDGDNWGTWGGYHRWEIIEETSQHWVVLAWLETNATFPNDNAPEDFLTADLAIRRPQLFKPLSGEMISWDVKDASTGNVLQSGTSMVADDNFVVAPQISVYRDDIRTVIISLKSNTTSIQEASAHKADLQVSPNPSHGIIIAAPGWKAITIVDLTGIQIKRIEISDLNQAVDVSFLPAGCYLIGVLTNDKNMLVGKFVKL